MKRALKLIGLLVIVCLVVASATVGWFLYLPSDYERRLAAVERQSQLGVELGHWPGVMWAVVAPGQVLDSGAAGKANIGDGLAMTPETVMPIGSITKVLVGLSGALAAEQGKLELDAPISDHLSIPFDPPDGSPRSFAQLATHTAGIVDTEAGYEEIGYHFGDVRHPMSLAAFLSGYLGRDGDLYSVENFAKWQPGERYSYSNVGAGLAGQVIADAVNEPFAEYSTTRIIEPLGLSGFWGQQGAPADSSLRQATLYDRDESGRFVALEPYGLATWPDGQFNASVQDLAKLMAVLLNEGRWDGSQVVPAAAVDLQQTPRIFDLPGKETDGDYIGLFWEKETLELGPFALTFIGHSGGDPGVLTFMYQVPDSATAFVLMFNGKPDDMVGAFSMVRLIQLLSGMPLPENAF